MKVTPEGKRRLLVVAVGLALLVAAGLAWLRADQPVSTAQHLYEDHRIRFWGGEYDSVFKVPSAGVVCGGYRYKDSNGKFREPSPFIVWFQTRDWFSWRDPVLLVPTPNEPLFFKSGDPAADQRRWDEELAKLAKERASNDYYKFADVCQRAVSVRRGR